MKTFLLGLGLLMGLLWAQKPPIPEEKLAHWQAVVVLREYKPVPEAHSLYYEPVLQHILTKVGFHKAEVVSAQGERLTLRLLTDPDMPPSDIQEVLRAAGTTLYSLTTEK